MIPFFQMINQDKACKLYKLREFFYSNVNQKLLFLFDQFGQCLSAQTDEYSTDHIIPRIGANSLNFPQ